MSFSKEQFQKRRDKIEAGVSQKEILAVAYGEQGFAKLYCECGWTTREIAEEMGCTQQLVSLLLIFGRFLGFLTTRGCQKFTIPKNLTEKRFREFWALTPKGQNEHGRFVKVVELMQGKVVLRDVRSSNICEKISKEVDMHEWFTCEEMAEKLELPLKSITSSVQSMRKGTKGNCVMEDRLFRDTRQYVIVDRLPKKIQIDLLHYTQLVARLEACCEEVMKVIRDRTWASTSLDLIHNKFHGVLQEVRQARKFIDKKSSPTSSADVRPSERGSTSVGG